jgi:hypothetical protein
MPGAFSKRGEHIDSAQSTGIGASRPYNPRNRQSRSCEDQVSQEINIAKADFEKRVAFLAF